MYQVRETIESKDHRQKIDSGQIIRSVVRRFVRLLAAAAVGRTALSYKNGPWKMGSRPLAFRGMDPL
jgi:hypothetical protein